MPRVSIGMPVYNGESYLENALQSILAQTYDDFELIISDNASSDATGEICNDYASKDPRIRYHENVKNLGAQYNYNHVFRMSTGEYFKWAAHDDIHGADYIQRCVEVLDQNASVILAYPRTVIIDEHGETLRKYDDGLHLQDSNPAGRFIKCLSRPGLCNAVFGLIRSGILEKTSLIANYNGSDNILLAQLAILGRFHEIPEELFFRRDHPEASGQANPDAADLAAWYDTARNNKIVMPSVRLLIEYIRSIQVSEMRLEDKSRCLAFMGKWVWWEKARLLNEIRVSLTLIKTLA